MDLYLGIDTSNYTTSLAVIDENNNLIVDERILLNVKRGTRGLRQSEAVFQHVVNFPQLVEKAFSQINSSDIKAIGVSLRPRPCNDSYMPVFNVGKTLAVTLSKALNVPLIFSSHQEGHIMAGIWSCGQELRQDFITIHLSGGTTEILKVQIRNRQPFTFTIEKIGGTTDLHAGQFIDRIGVEMGLPFPAGPHLELIAKESANPCEIPVAVENLNVSFSGPESHSQRLLKRGENISDIARGVEDCIANSLEKLIEKVYDIHGQNLYLVVGGVASNKYISQKIKSSFNIRTKDVSVVFAAGKYSSDNAVGISLIAQSGV